MAFSRRWFLAGLAAALAAAAPASARMHSPYRGHRIVPGTSAPLDSFATPAGAYSFRRLKSTYAGPAIRIRRASDNAETDINFLGCTGFTGCPWDEAAATAHCAATTCFAKTIYNQIGGNVRDLTQTGAANQPQLVFSCNGALPCLRVPATAYIQAGVNLTPATGIVSLAGVAKRTSGTGGASIFQHSGGAGNFMAFRSAATGIRLTSGTDLLTGSAENAWHSAIGVINGASSSLTVDGAAAVTGSLSAVVTAGLPGIGGVAATSMDWSEAISWDNYALTAGEIAALGANQRSFWGF